MKKCLKKKVSKITEQNRVSHPSGGRSAAYSIGLSRVALIIFGIIFAMAGIEEMQGESSQMDHFPLFACEKSAPARNPRRKGCNARQIICTHVWVWHITTAKIQKSKDESNHTVVANSSFASLKTVEAMPKYSMHGLCFICLIKTPHKSFKRQCFGSTGI